MSTPISVRIPRGEAGDRRSSGLSALPLRRLRPGLEPLIHGGGLRLTPWSEASWSGASRSETLRDLRKSKLVGARQVSSCRSPAAVRAAAPVD